MQLRVGGNGYAALRQRRTCVVRPILLMMLAFVAVELAPAGALRHLNMPLASQNAGWLPHTLRGICLATAGLTTQLETLLL
jgi:hypothetical protein